MQTKARAEAEAFALKVKKESVTPELIALKRAEAFIKAVEKWDGALPKMMSNATSLLDVNNL